MPTRNPHDRQIAPALSATKPSESAGVAPDLPAAPAALDLDAIRDGLDYAGGHSTYEYQRDVSALLARVDELEKVMRHIHAMANDSLSKDNLGMNDYQIEADARAVLHLEVSKSG